MVSVDKKNKCMAIVSPGRVLERRDLRTLRRQLEDLLNGEPKLVLLDFSHTEHVYYRLADLLTHIDTAFKRRRKRLILTGMSRYLQDIFWTVSDFNRFELVASRGEAMTSDLC